MAHIDNTHGNILIKHHDNWRGDYYLQEDLTFVPDRALAARFQLLKSGNTEIINGDRVSINRGNKVLIIDYNDRVKLMDRDHIHRETSTFLVTNGTDDINPVAYESPMYIISDRQRKKALKYHWGMEPLVVGSKSPADYCPESSPTLINTYMVPFEDNDIRLFELTFENAYAPRSEEQVRVEETTSVKSKWLEWFESVRGPLLLVLLLIVLVLSILTSR